jgi:hypothetical protein
MKRWSLLTSVIAIGGCAGSAELQFVSTNLAAINPPPPIVYRYEPQQCYWWIDDDGSLNIAMQFDRVNLFSEIGRLRLQASLMFDAPPAGSGRDYVVGSRNLRGRFESPLAKARLISTSGVVSVSKAGDRFRGSFRILLQQHPGLSLLSLTPQRRPHDSRRHGGRRLDTSRPILADHPAGHLSGAAGACYRSVRFSVAPRTYRNLLKESNGDADRYLHADDRPPKGEAANPCAFRRPAASARRSLFYS